MAMARAMLVPDYDGRSPDYLTRDLAIRIPVVGEPLRHQ